MNGVRKIGARSASPYQLVSDKVQCVVNMYGITNLLTRQKVDPDGRPTGELVAGCAMLKQDRNQDPEGWRFASPVSHISKDSPPTLILHGKMDATVDYEQALELERVLKEHGVEHELHLIEGIGHTFNLQSWRNKPLPYDLRPVVVGFFDKYLKK